MTTAEKVIKALKANRGFGDWWWDELEPDIKAKITLQIEQVIQEDKRSDAADLTEEEEE